MLRQMNFDHENLNKKYLAKSFTNMIWYPLFTNISILSKCIILQFQFYFQRTAPMYWKYAKLTTLISFWNPDESMYYVGCWLLIKILLSWHNASIYIGYRAHIFDRNKLCFIKTHYFLMRKMQKMNFVKTMFDITTKIQHNVGFVITH